METPVLNTEERILEAAKKVFHRKGYDGARMQELAGGLSAFERASGRDGVSAEEVRDILGALAADGFVVRKRTGWFVAERHCS